MKAKTKIQVFLLLAILVLTSCCTEEPFGKTPSRTVLAYIAAENSLNPFAYENISGMIAGASGENLNGGNLLVYIDTNNEAPRLLQIRKGPNGAIEQQTVKTYEEHNSVSIEVMRLVLDDVFKNEAFKAESQGLILWSHGTAWLPSDLDNYLRAFGQDASDWMELNGLRDALKGYHFDFIIFDACYMANIETGYALRDNADYILASPTEVLGAGLPYHQVTKYLFSDGPVATCLQHIGETFYNYYETQEGGVMYPKSASTALMKTEKLPLLAALTREILNGKEQDIFNLQLSKLQILERLGRPNHTLYDFGDFVSQLATEEQLVRFKNCLDEVVVYKETTDIAYYINEGTLNGFPIDRARYCGISAYVPQKHLVLLNEWYKQLDWYKAVYEP
jgi:hypothetical protein